MWLAWKFTSETGPPGTDIRHSANMERSSRENPTTTPNTNAIHLQALATATTYARLQLTKEEKNTFAEF